MIKLNSLPIEDTLSAPAILLKKRREDAIPASLFSKNLRKVEGTLFDNSDGIPLEVYMKVRDFRFSLMAIHQHARGEINKQIML